MTKQLFFDLQNQPATGAFLISPSNQDAAAWIERWPNWPNTGLIIYGPPCSGKTHLLSLWCKQAKGTKLSIQDLNVEDILQYKNQKAPNIAIDNVDKIITDDQQAKAVFHLYNMIKEQNGTLLLTASEPISIWDCSIADTLSRLKTLPGVSIKSPDEQILQSLLVKLFSDRQLRISTDVISYILKRTERSFLAIKQLVQRLDQEALSQKHPITIPMVRNILDNMQKNY